MPRHDLLCIIVGLRQGYLVRYVFVCRRRKAKENRLIDRPTINVWDNLIHLINQESIPVGCVPPACQPYPVVSHVWGNGVGGVGGYPPLDIPTPWTYPTSRRDMVSEIPPGKDTVSKIPPMDRQTDTCENITFSQLCLRMVMIRLSKWDVWNYPWRGSRRGSSPVPHCVHVEFRAKSWHRLPNICQTSM